MAAASGPPQDSPKTKKEITPEQKKLYAGLAIIGVLTLAVAGMYLPGMLSGGSSSDATTGTTTNTVAATGAGAADNTAAVPGAGGPTGPMDAAAGADPTLAGAAPAAGVTTASYDGEPIGSPRSDPFQQPYLIPTPVPVPPPPVDVPVPTDDGPINLPGSNIEITELRKPLILPQVRITRLDEASRRPTDAFPPRRSSGDSGSAGGASVSPSFDKRLSGVVIGDGVRALLEIQGPTGTVTRVVQPGDEVDGITVLNIQRYKEGGNTVTRMLIRENGEEKSVDLGPSLNPPGATGGLGGPEGLSPAP
jgi:hypothetical protein